MPPRVTILLPARDAAATLPACLRSIARQSHADFCCLVIDDGSRDATAATAQEFAARDRRFALLAGEGRGITAALLRGLDRVDSPFLARMDADDVMHRDRLRLQLAALERSAELALVGCHARPFPGPAIGAGMRAYATWLRSIRCADDVARDAFIECPLLHPTWCARTSALRRHGYRQGDWPEDYELLLRMLQSGERLGVVPRILHGWRRAPDSASATDPRYSIAAFGRLRAAYLASGILAPVDRYVLWGYGSTGKSLRRELERHGKSPVAIVELHPGRLGQTIHGAPVVPPRATDELAEWPLIASVAGIGARRQLRAFLHRRGRREGRDFVCAA